jgi:hypothetical protein
LPENEETRLGALRGLVADEIEAAVMELTLIVSHAKSRQALYHVHADPKDPWTDRQYDRFWELLEEEFGFQSRPFVEAVHLKNGRQHRHRVYSRVRADGTVIPLYNDYQRREKIARRVEFEFGEQHVVGRHNRRVAALLTREGHADVVASMVKAGMLTAPKPEARLTPAQRHQADRTGIDVEATSHIALQIWEEMETGELEAAFAAQGLRLCLGDEVPVLVDLAGGVHSLTRSIGRASAARGCRIRAAEVKQRISQLTLPIHKEGGTDGRAETTQANRKMDAQASDECVEAQAFTGSDAVSRPGDTSNRRSRVHSCAGRRAARFGQYRRGQKAARRLADTQARRKNELGTHPGLAGSNAEDAAQKPAVATRGLRKVIRARSTEHRVECYLTEPDFNAKLEQLEAMADLLDPTRPICRAAEDLRVETMLAAEEYQPVLLLLEQFAIFIFAFIDWIVRFLCGSSPERERENEMPGPLTVEEPSYPGLAP